MTGDGLCFCQYSDITMQEQGRILWIAAKMEW